MENNGVLTYTSPLSVVSREVGGETVLVDLDGEQYFSLNATGSLIWTSLSSGRSLDETVAQMVSAFEIDPGTARRDLEELVESLVAAGLLIAS